MPTIFLRRAVAVALLLAIGGCARQVLLWNAQVGRLVDNSTGYYAVTTSIEASDQTPIVAEIGTTQRIEGQIRLVREDTVKIYLRGEYYYPRLYIPPEQLLLLEGTTSDSVATVYPDTLKLGFFVNYIDDSKVGNFHGTAHKSSRKGVEWREATDSLLNLIQTALDKMRTVAEREGGERILDMTVFWTDGYAPFGLNGIYITGEVVAFGEVIEP